MTVTRLEHPGVYWLNVLCMAFGLGVSLLVTGLLPAIVIRQISN